MTEAKPATITMMIETVRTPNNRCKEFQMSTTSRTVATAPAMARPRRLHRAAAITAGSLVVLLTGCITTSPSLTTGAAEPSEQPTAEFRLHHADVLEHLGHVDEMAARLGQETGDQRLQTMQRMIGFFNEHIGPHAMDEERVLYPAVQQRAGEGNRLTEVPIYEHRIVERWIKDLETEAARPWPDAAAFSQKAVHLVGLLRAHFEVEEQVLLPILDATMTPAQFKREVGDRMAR